MKIFTIKKELSNIKLSQAQQMKQLSAEGKLDEKVMLELMSQEKPNQQDKLKIKRDRVAKYFPKDYTAQLIEGIHTQIARRLAQKSDERPGINTVKNKLYRDACITD